MIRYPCIEMKRLRDCVDEISPLKRESRDQDGG